MRYKHYQNKSPSNTSTAAILCLFLLSACSHISQIPGDDWEKTITAEVNEAFYGLVDAAQSLKTKQYLAYFDPKRFTGLNDDGTVIHSLRDFEIIFRKQIPSVKRYISLEFKSVKISVINPTTAILVNEYIAKVELKTGSIISSAGAGTQVWNKQSRHWKLVSVSSSLRNE